MENNNNNNWQRCPVCYGSGLGHNMYGSGPCNTCSGHGIISTLSGIPPEFKKNETYLGSTTELQNIFKPNGKVSTSWDTTNPNIDYNKNLRADEDKVKITKSEPTRSTYTSKVFNSYNTEEEKKDRAFCVRPYYRWKDPIAIFRNKDDAHMYAVSISSEEDSYIVDEIETNMFKNLL